MLLLGVLVLGAIVAIPFVALKSSAAYGESLAAVRGSAEVREDFGEPLTPSWLVSGRVHAEKDRGEADIEYGISGPKAQGTVIAKGIRANGVWTFSTLCVRRADGKVYDLLADAGRPAAEGEASSAQALDLVIAQSVPGFMKGASSGVTAERVPGPPLPPAPTALRLTPVDGSSAPLETAFLSALLNNKPEQALAMASNSFLLEGGIEILKFFGELAQERGGGTYTPQKTAQLEDGQSAVVGEVLFNDGTRMKVTVLTRAGKVEGFTSAR